MPVSNIIEQRTSLQACRFCATLRALWNFFRLWFVPSARAIIAWKLRSRYC